MKHHYFFDVIPSTLMDLLHLGTFYNKEEVDVVLCGCGTLWMWYFVAVVLCGWLRKESHDLCSSGIFKQLLRWGKNASLGLRIMLRKHDNSMK